MIVDASVVIDAVADAGPRGAAARDALRAQPSGEALVAPGHFAVEVMSGLRAVANRPGRRVDNDALVAAFREAEAYGIAIEATPWADVHRAWVLSQASLRYADALYVATAERHGTVLLTSDMRIARSGAPMKCQVLTIAAGGEQYSARHLLPGEDR